MADLFPERIETDRLELEALSTDAVDPLTHYDHASDDRMNQVMTHLSVDPHDHPREYVDRFGGQHEGLLRNFQVNDDGTVVDMHQYAITREQYESATTETA